MTRLAWLEGLRADILRRVHLGHRLNSLHRHNLLRHLRRLVIEHHSWLLWPEALIHLRIRRESWLHHRHLLLELRMHLLSGRVEWRVLLCRHPHWHHRRSLTLFLSLLELPAVAGCSISMVFMVFRGWQDLRLLLFIWLLERNCVNSQGVLGNLLVRLRELHSDLS